MSLYRWGRLVNVGIRKPIYHTFVLHPRQLILSYEGPHFQTRVEFGRAKRYVPAKGEA